MDKKYDNLRSKTIFDFTRDEKILKEILSESDFLDFKENQNELIKESKEWTEFSRISDIIYYSNIIKNDELYDSIKIDFEDKYPCLFSDGI